MIEYRLFLFHTCVIFYIQSSWVMKIEITQISESQEEVRPELFVDEESGRQIFSLFSVPLPVFNRKVLLLTYSSYHDLPFWITEAVFAVIVMLILFQFQSDWTKCFENSSTFKHLLLFLHLNTRNMFKNTGIYRKSYCCFEMSIWSTLLLYENKN